MDRRTFLKSAPLRLAKGIKTLLAHEGGIHRRLAILDISRCLAWGTGGCQICYLRCPLRDEAMVLEGDKPTVVASTCDGCGICVAACRAVNDLGAIQIVEL